MFLHADGQTAWNIWWMFVPPDSIIMCAGGRQSPPGQLWGDWRMSSAIRLVGSAAHWLQVWRELCCCGVCSVGHG